VPSRIPHSRAPLTDPNNGVIDPVWFAFLYDLFLLTGSGTNGISLTDLQLAPSMDGLVAQFAETTKAIQALQVAPSTNDLLAQIADLRSIVQGLQAAPAPIIPEDPVSSDFMLDVARGVIPGMSSVSKFGAAPDGVQTSLTDIWGRADAAATQQIWLAPTAARIHAIVSDSASDDGSPVGVGARTLRVYGLTSWSTVEVSEDITLNGTGAVNTANSYVIINRMKVLTSGTTSINVGTIIATAATDATVGAVILPTRGQTEQCVYGIPSTQKLYIDHLSLSMNATGATTAVDFELLVNENPDVQTTNYIVKNTTELSSTGTSAILRRYTPLYQVVGPAIVKIQAISSSADTDASAGFGGVLITN